MHPWDDAAIIAYKVKESMVVDGEKVGLETLDSERRRPPVRPEGQPRLRLLAGSREGLGPRILCGRIPDGAHEENGAG